MISAKKRRGAVCESRQNTKRRGVRDRYGCPGERLPLKVFTVCPDPGEKSCDLFLYYLFDGIKKRAIEVAARATRVVAMTLIEWALSCGKGRLLSFKRFHMI